MSAYISTQTITSSLRQSVMKLQAELSASQTEVATGNYADIGLALGSRTGESVSLQAESSMLQTIRDTNSAAATRLDATQNRLADLQSMAQTLLNALLSTNRGGSGAEPIQTNAASDLRSLISTLNSTLGGDYLFSGVNTSVAPIIDYYGPGASNKQAVDAAFSNTFGMSQASPGVSSISGAAMQSFLDTQFAPLFQGTDWTTAWSSASDRTLTSAIGPKETVSTSVSANEPAFQKLAQAYTMLADLNTPHLGADAYQSVATTARNLVSSAITGLIDLQARVGLVQSSMSNSSDRMSLQIDLLSTQISNVESVNTYEASTRVSELQTQIETAYSLTSQLKRLSLVNFL